MNSGNDHLLILRGPREGQQISLASLPLTMGRLQTADVMLEAASVSRSHARLSQSESGYVIEDLGSSNGTFVNEERIDRPRLLANGDHIRLGTEVELVAVVEPALAPP